MSLSEQHADRITSKVHVERFLEAWAMKTPANTISRVTDSYGGMDDMLLASDIRTLLDWVEVLREQRV